MATPRAIDVDTDGLGDYTSLFTAEDTEDATNPDISLTGGSDEYVVFTCRASSGSADTTAVTINNWTTEGPDNYIEVVAHADHKASTLWNNTIYRLEVANSIVLAINDDDVRLKNLQIGKSSTTADSEYNVSISSLNNTYGTEHWIEGCLLRQPRDANNDTKEPCIGINDANAVVKIWHTGCYGAGTFASTGNSVIFIGNCTTVDIYSSILEGGFKGLHRAAGTVVAKNCWAGNAVNNDYDGIITMTNCASSDTTASGTSPVDSVLYQAGAEAYFTNVTGGSEDFSLSSASSKLYNTGYNSDTGGDPAPFDFTDDINGTARPQSTEWDIGMFEFIVAAGGANPKGPLGHPLIGAFGGPI